MFYVLAVLIVLAALGAVLAPSTRVALLAVLAGDVLVGILLIAAGAYLLGVVALVAPGGCLLARGRGAAPLRLRAAARRHPRAAPQAWPSRPRSRAASACCSSGPRRRASTTPRTAPAAGQDLLTVLHYRTPISVGVAVILAGRSPSAGR